MTSDSGNNSAVAALRGWLTLHLGHATPDELAERFGLSVVCVLGLIGDELSRRMRLARRVVPDWAAAESGPLTVGEDAFLTLMTSGQLETDTVRWLALRFRLTEMYVRAQLAEHGVRLAAERDDSSPDLNRDAVSAGPP